MPADPVEAARMFLGERRLGFSLANDERQEIAAIMADYLAAHRTPAPAGDVLRDLPEVLPGHWTTAGGRDMALATLDGPHMARSRERISDFALANEVFLSPGIANLTDAKERIRWLSAMLAASTTPDSSAVRGSAEGLREALEQIVRANQVRHWTATKDNPESHWVVSDGPLAAIARAALTEGQQS